MKFPTWIKPGLLGAIAGAICCAVVGFSYGGWMTSGSAQTLASKQATAAVSAALMPYCVEKSTTDPQAQAVLAALRDAQNFKRRSIVEDAGWATPLGAERPNSALAQECLVTIAASL